MKFDVWMSSQLKKYIGNEPEMPKKIEGDFN